MINVPNQGTTQEESEMQREYGKLIQVKSRTSELVLELEQRLNAVMRPAHPTPTTPNKEGQLKPLLSPLGESYNQLTNELEEINNLLTDLLNRLAL